MAKTLLNGVNEVLKKAKLIQGDSGSLTTLSDSPRQVWIDNAVQSWNEVVQELYETCDLPMPRRLGESTITLATGTRTYDLASDVVTLYWPLKDETNGQFIYESDYLTIVNSQPIPADYTGLANYAAIDPTNDDPSQLYLDRIPTATENGLVYKYRYERSALMSVAADTVPFNNDIFYALVPAVTEMFNLHHRREMNEGIFRMSMGRAARMLSAVPARSSYINRGTPSTDGIMYPFDGD